MQDLEQEHSQAAIHEHAHLVAEHAELHLPVWLNEGLADLYSTLEPHGQKAMVGRPLLGRMYVLMTQSWMDWNTLFRVDQHSPYYNESNKMSIFYAQSWALADMLALDDRYRPAFPKFVALVVAGKSPEEAFSSVYGKTVKQVGNDLRTYIGGVTFKAALFDVPLQKAALDPQISPLPDDQLQFGLADLLAQNEPTMAEAQKRLTALEKQYGPSAEIEESLGYLAWRRNQLAEAEERFGKAVQNHSTNALMIYQYATLLGSTGASPSEVIRLLQQSLALDPSNTDARLLLGVKAAENRQFGCALSTLSEIQRIKPAQLMNIS